jgi:hypothetical protein
MKLFGICSAVIFCLFLPLRSSAQSTGRIECARLDGYVYLYSSFATMEVRATLPCGAMVQITSHDDKYVGVQTAKGETGFVPASNVVLLKDAPSGAVAASGPVAPARERTPYDEPLHPGAAPVRDVSHGFTLAKDTPIRVKLLKTISSGSAHVGDAVEFEVLDDILIEGVPVLTKGAKASGVVAEAEAKKRFGHGGKIAVSLTAIHLADGEILSVRCYEEATGSSNTSSDAVLPLASGKDVALLQDSEYTALVDGDFHAKREGFVAVKDTSGGQTAQAPPQR